MTEMCSGSISPTCGCVEVSLKSMRRLKLNAGIVNAGSHKVGVYCAQAAHLLILVVPNLCFKYNISYTDSCQATHILTPAVSGVNVKGL